MRVRQALISVSDKTGVVEFAKGLKALGIEILSTGGTSKTLKDNGVDVVEVSDYTGSPEILDGRLKTLHPLIHGGILGIRANAGHIKEMSANGIMPIDLVAVNLYPFEKTISKENCTLEEAIENIDIGGPTMIRAAAKNWQDVAVVVDPADYSGILSELQKNNCEIKKETKFALAQKVFAHTARYDAAICNYINQGGGAKFPSRLAFAYEKAQELRYGENPHQQAAFYREYNIAEPCVANIEQLHGKELSYNNIMDTDAAIELVKEFAGRTFVAILKHTNPCGAAVSDISLADAFNKAKETDPVSAFGGIVGVSRPVDAETAKAIADTFFEVIVAPDFSEDALKILTKKKDIRLLKLPALSMSLRAERSNPPWTTRKVVGGLLLQERDLGMADIRKCNVVTEQVPSDDEYAAMDFAWRICKHVKSNAIVYSSEDQLLGVGAGQMSRVDSAKIAGIKMNEMFTRVSKPSTIVCASDAFFPFRDGIDTVAAAGAKAIVQPGGSKRDEEGIHAANEHKVAMIFTSMRHFKH